MLNKKLLLKYLIVIVVTYAMFLGSYILDEKEIIFPEVAALLIGAVIMPKMPWKTSKHLMVILMGISAIMGIGIVIYLPIPMYLQVMLGFVLMIAMLSISKSTMVPIISACVLPIMMKTESIIYPIFVVVITIIIAAIRSALESTELAIHSDNIKYEYNFKENILRIIVFAIAAILPVFTRNYFFIAPPLIVTFIEFSFAESGARKNYKKILILIALSAIIGSTCRLLNGNSYMSLYNAALIAIICVIACMHMLKTYFPPAGAICLLPLIINYNSVLLYPIEVIIGSIILIWAAITVFRSKASQSAS